MPEQMPIIKLEMQHMKQAMMVALGEHQAQISEHVQRNLDQMIESFDYDQVISEAINAAIKEAIFSYFKYGEGARLISLALKETLSVLFPGSVRPEDLEELKESLASWVKRAESPGPNPPSTPGGDAPK